MVVVDNSSLQADSQLMSGGLVWESAGTLHFFYTDQMNPVNSCSDLLGTMNRIECAVKHQVTNQLTLEVHAHVTQFAPLSVLTTIFQVNLVLPFLLKLKMMEVGETTGEVRRAKLPSNRHHQQTNIQCFTGRMPFLSSNHECRSTEGKDSYLVFHVLWILTSFSPWTWVSQCLLKQRVMEVVATTGLQEL